MRGLVGHVLDQGKAEFVLEVSLPELLVVVQVLLVLRHQQFLREAVSTPAAVVLNSAYS